jgi:hypothetical protein
MFTKLERLVWSLINSSFQQLKKSEIGKRWRRMSSPSWKFSRPLATNFSLKVIKVPKIEDIDGSLKRINVFKID